jgi:hypothetical protein
MSRRDLRSDLIIAIVENPPSQIALDTGIHNMISTGIMMFLRESLRFWFVNNLL